MQSKFYQLWAERAPCGTSLCVREENGCSSVCRLQFLQPGFSHRIRGLHCCWQCRRRLASFVRSHALRSRPYRKKVWLRYSGGHGKNRGTGQVQRGGTTPCASCSAARQEPQSNCAQCATDILAE